MESGLLVGGRWVDDGDEHIVTDRYTGEVAGTVAHARRDDVAAAVSAGLDVHKQPMGVRERAAVLCAAADLLDDDAEAVIRDYVAETGFTRADAETELARALETLRLSAQEGLRLAGEVVPVASAGSGDGRVAFTIQVPVGVVAAIVPFNAPLNTLVHKVGPALAAGNAVVIKPAQATPLSAIHVCSALLEAGLPPGYLSLLPGPGSTVGNWLLEDPRIRYFTFTGSTSVGLLVKQRSGIAKTHLELGANSATIVCADANLDAAASLIVRAGYRKAGQVCTSVQRVLVETAVAEALEERLADRVRSLVAGDPHATDTQLGPMIAEREADRACSWVAEAVEAGATLLVGGTRAGALLAATLLTDVPVDCRLMQEEIFAPVVAIRPVADLEEAITIANATPYGLQAGIFTANLDRAFRAAYQLDVGGVMINDTSSYHADLMPYGGVKGSGYGLEGPRYAVRDMTDPRIIVFNGVLPGRAPA